jgi:hypothetical protein
MPSCPRQHRRRRRSEAGVDEQLLPMIKGAPGFLGAYFVAVDDSHGIAIEAFDTDPIEQRMQQRRALASLVDQGGVWPVPGERRGLGARALQFDRSFV